MTIQFTPNIQLPYPQASDQVSLGATDMENIVQALDGGSGGSTSGPTAALVKKGVLASLPSAGQPLGSVYICTDTACGFWSDGSAWHYIPLGAAGGSGGTGTAPVGSMMQYGGSTDPVDPDGQTRWLICDGRALSRTTYATLFTNIATTYGSGNGSTTFNIPDGRQRFLLGKSTSGTGQTLGSTGGSIDHTHPLDGTNAGAMIGVGNNSSDFNLLYKLSDSAGTFSPGSLDGHWNIQGSWSSGATDVGVTSKVTGTTDVANPPYVTVNHIIRAL